MPPRLELSLNPAPTTREEYLAVAKRLSAELSPVQFQVLLKLALALESTASVPEIAQAAHFLARNPDG